MDKQYPIADAKNKLPSIIHAVEKGPPIKITRHGRPVAVLISIHEYESLSKQKKDFWPSLSAFLDSIDKNQLNLYGTEFEGIRDRSRGRDFKW